MENWSFKNIEGNETVGIIGSAGKGVSTGATVGSLFGPAGTLIGGAIGGVVGAGIGIGKAGVADKHIIKQSISEYDPMSVYDSTARNNTYGSRITDRQEYKQKGDTKVWDIADAGMTMAGTIAGIAKDQNINFSSKDKIDTLDSASTWADKQLLNLKQYSDNKTGFEHIKYDISNGILSNKENLTRTLKPTDVLEYNSKDLYQDMIKDFNNTKVFADETKASIFDDAKAQEIERQYNNMIKLYNF